LQKVPFVVRTIDVESFVKAFFWLDGTDQQALIKQYPAHVYYLHTQSVTTDILPLLNVRMAFPQVQFTVLPDLEDHGEHYWTATMCEYLKKFLVYTSRGLRHDLQASRISEFCCHCDGRFYVWYKPGNEPYGVNMTLDKEGQEFVDETHKMLGVEGSYDIHCGISFDGIDQRNCNNSTCRRVEDVM
jgi:hypothetical protein